MEIRLIQLKKRYGKIMAVDIPELTIRSGELVGLIGHNGAGKTTLLRLILDLVAPTEGCVLLDGQDVRRTTAWKQHTAAYLDEGFLIPFLTPGEYLTLVGQAYGLDKAQYQARLKSLAPFLDPMLLSERKYVRDLSAGNRQRLGLAATLLAHPRLVVLDEPFEHLDPTGRKQFSDLIRTWNTTHAATILLATHNLSEVKDLVQRVLLMEAGRLIYDQPNTPATWKQVHDYFARVASHG
ncbi:MAG: ABC transporter ATP-binding protein [Rhodothermus sp.]|nr:ABC transporter ATP-binding protein [Rhodothermus sp.]